MIPSENSEFHDLRLNQQMNRSGFPVGGGFPGGGVSPVPPGVQIVDNSYTRDAANIIPGQETKR